MIINACKDKKNWSCPFEGTEHPYCNLMSKCKKKWCYYKKEKIGFGLPPKWCPLRKESITVRLLEGKE